MAGVAGPMLRDDRWGGTRFLLGLLVGGILGAAVLAVPFYLLATGVTAVLPEAVRVGLVIVVALGFGVADLRQRTPHVWRQVPQSLVRTLPPGSLGVVWGFDLALLFTTQKTTSFLWVALAALVLLSPAALPTTLIVVAVLAVLSMVALSIRKPTTTPIDEEKGRRWQDWQRIIRRWSGATLLVAAVAQASLLNWG
ncbi:hypothetical protein OOJ91_14140 [Micromonospora lupini]|uniref:hypothetical protein n=1 Tax=Micromonospora lupini TaxID=285679 RepID=UPI002257F544|nr:hypothetical protein [Micromonospora lupini]MCX5066987.1 hypothetical protein [Micromonospora lupini]